MTILSFEAPLRWPEWRAPTPRAQQREDSGFSQHMTLEDAIGYLEEEIRQADANRAVLNTDIDHLQVERLRRRVGNRSGARLDLWRHGKRYGVACDRWQKMECNIYVLHLTLRNQRHLERWGSATLDELLQPFLLSGLDTGGTDKAEHPPAQESWMEALGLGPTATLDDVTAIYHRRAKQLANDSHALAELNVIIEEARGALLSRKQ